MRTADETAARPRPGTRSARSRPSARKKSKRTRRPVWQLVAMVAGGALLVVFFLAVAERVVYSGKVMPGVDVEGVDVAGQSEDDSYADISALASDLETQPLHATIDGREVVADASLLEVDVDEAATLRDARKAARSGNPIEQTIGAVLRRFRPDDVSLHVSYNEAGLAGVIDAWERETLDGRVEGNIEFDGTKVVEVLPKAGTGLQRDEARELLDEELHRAERKTVKLPVGKVQPKLTRDDVATAAAQARAILGKTHDLATDGATITITPEQLVSAMGTTARESAAGGPGKARADADASLELTIDPEKLRAALGDSLGALETAPVDATFEVTSSGGVNVVPSQNGRQVDMTMVADALLEDQTHITAALEETPPEHDTAWAESLHIKEQVSTFTTNHRAGEERVKNIHRAADLLNNTIVEPGATFSLNDTIGPRTEERGFVVAPVFYGEFTEDFGGGVSQLATTTFTAVFWGGYEDVYHKPHTIYITRYPMGREATVNYPTVDLKFKNNTSAGVLIRTSYSSSSITVTFYGDKEGKTVNEEDRKVLGETPVGDLYYDCPAPANVDPNNVCANLPEGQSKRVEEGHAGADVEFYRVIEQPGHDTTRERFFWRYRKTDNKTVIGHAAAPTTTVAPGATTATSTPTVAETTVPPPTVPAPNP
ncbi:MAG TPA: VanW family protein [Acidimicrobiia bacterium]|nr:VanW family protein [Acidimicrobiia bacterium]